MITAWLLSIVMVWTTAKYYIPFAARTCQNLTFERHLYGILYAVTVSKKLVFKAAPLLNSSGAICA